MLDQTQNHDFPTTNGRAIYSGLFNGVACRCCCEVQQTSFASLEICYDPNEWISESRWFWQSVIGQIIVRLSGRMTLEGRFLNFFAGWEFEVGVDYTVMVAALRRRSHKFYAVARSDKMNRLRAQFQPTQ